MLTLAADERSLLSGSWDRNVNDWDLNTGQVTRQFAGSGGQISSIEFRSHTANTVWDEIRREPLVNGVSAGSRSASGAGDLANGLSAGSAVPNGVVPAAVDAGEQDAPGSPAESTRSFNSLFGEDDDIVLGGDGDEMQQAIVNGLDMPPPSQEAADLPMADLPLTNGHAPSVPSSPPPPPLLAPAAAPAPAAPSPAPAALAPGPTNGVGPPPLPPGPTTDQNTFLAASMDGTLRLWDRRCEPPIAVSHPGKGVPPWCMSACWGTDGNFLYAGRRNGTVEEYSVHKGLGEPTRTLKFPLGSGSVTAMTAMPNGRHLICASFDNLRLYDLKHQDRRGGPTVPFLIIPGHHGGAVSHLCKPPSSSSSAAAVSGRLTDGRCRPHMPVSCPHGRESRLGGRQHGGIVGLRDRVVRMCCIHYACFGWCFVCVARSGLRRFFLLLFFFPFPLLRL